MNLESFLNKKVKVLLGDGQVFIGFVVDYRSPIDNEYDGGFASIQIGSYELYANEVVEITELADD